MSAPTEVRLGDFQPEIGSIIFDPMSEEAVSEALAIRRAIGELAEHSSQIPPTAIAETMITVEEAVDASFVSRKSTEPVKPPKHLAPAFRIMNRDTTVISSSELEPTGGYVPDVDLDVVDALWKPTDPTEVKAAQAPIKLDPISATVAKVALEEVAKQNLASIDDAEKAAEVKEARDVLRELFHEEVAVLPPEKPKEPELPFVIPAEERRRRQSLGKLASLSLLFLLSGRR